MKNSKILRDYVRAIMKEGQLLALTPEQVQANLDAEAAATKAAATKKVTDAMSNASTWLNSNRQEIFKAADYYNNPLPQERLELSFLVRSAINADKKQNPDFYFTTYALCIQIVGSSDIITTAMVTAFTDIFAGIYNSIMGESKHRLNEALPAILAAISGWSYAAIVATSFLLIDAMDDFDADDLGQASQDTDELKSRAATCLMEISHAIKGVDPATSAELDRIVNL